MIHPDKFWKSADEKDASNAEEEQDQNEEMENDNPNKSMNIDRSNRQTRNVVEKDGVIEILEEYENIGRHNTHLHITNIYIYLYLCLCLYANKGPIVDMCAVDLERQGQCQLVCCSGVSKDGSLRIVKNGIGIEQTAFIDMPGIEGLWSLTADSESTYHLYLIQSFVSETRVLTVAGEGLEEIVMQGLRREGKTVHLDNMNHDMFVQVTSEDVRLIHIQEPFCLAHTWTLESTKQKQINSAVSNRIQTGSELKLINSTTLENDISCVSLSPVASFEDRSFFAAVGLWKEQAIELMTLPEFQVFYTLHLQTQTVPRSVFITNFHCPSMGKFTPVPWVLCVLPHIHTFTFTTQVFCNDVEIIIYAYMYMHICIWSVGRIGGGEASVVGKPPDKTDAFLNGGRFYMYAGCDRPSIVYLAKDRMHYCNINLNDMNYLCSFNAEEYPDSLAMAVDQQLMIGSMDQVQKIHTRKVPLSFIATTTFSIYTYTYVYIYIYICVHVIFFLQSLHQTLRKRSNEKVVLNYILFFLQ
ncbi:hypothetical protein RFI_15272 [Reticulomyxa filosa]|uniref:RSE1/DDB1/CPSF1 second beta-propeller domain-containing protein n=1 Tax=Reticulomyxa filosa TaxID=46433 RepID=X6N7R2_RETFI|nr:hypothetical protein RFI_15272 [Reticulomyxa filosa]|eukprot:ETO21933.1 hypothetical protein RFI_15272 [Reticulomyxa filosa]